MATASHLTDSCGPHCGVQPAGASTVRAGHCNCAPLCHAGAAPPGQVLTADGQPVIAGAVLTGTPMCARWYERAGDYRPWTIQVRDAPAGAR